MWFSSPIVLNDGPITDVPADQPLDVALTLTMADLKAQFLDVDGGVIRYADMAPSEVFQRYETLANGLRSFDLHSLPDRTQRLAFWINIYNTAVIHGIARLGIRRSVKEVARFFHRIAYDIGGYTFS